MRMLLISQPRTSITPISRVRSINRHRHGIDDVDGRHQQGNSRYTAKNHLAAEDLLLHVLPLLVRGPGALKAQVMDGFFHIAPFFQVVDLDVNLIVGRSGVL